MAIKVTQGATPVAEPPAAPAIVPAAASVAVPEAAAPTAAVTPAVASGSDVLGFGKHNEKTYQEMWDHEPGYCIWAVNKYKDLVESKEETADPWIEGDGKLKRLAQWLMKLDDECRERGPIMDYDGEMNPIERQNSLTLAQRTAALRESGGPKFYGQSHPTVAVHKSWEECKAACIGVKGARFKSFSTEEEAWEWAKNPPARTSKPKVKKEGEEGENPPAKKVRTKTPAEEEAAAKKREEAAAKKAEKEKEKADAKAAKESERAEKELAKFREGEKKAAEKEAAKKEKVDAKVEAKASKEKEKEDAKAAKEAVKKGKEDAKAAKAQAKEDAKTAKEQEKAAKAEAKEAKAAAAAGKKRKADEAAQTDEKAEASPEPEGAAPAAMAEIPTPSRAEKQAKTTPEKTPAPKTGKGRGKKEDDAAKAASGVTLEEAILEEARELKYETALRNLAARPEIVAKGLEARALLDALKTSEGLVNPAKHALLAQ